MSEVYKAMMMEIAQENAMEHHGILGQKWGIRRFQNPNGTLTARGRERYKVGSNLTKRDYQQEDADRLAKRRSDMRTAAVMAAAYMLGKKSQQKNEEQEEQQKSKEKEFTDSEGEWESQCVKAALNDKALMKRIEKVSSKDTELNSAAEDFSRSTKRYADLFEVLTRDRDFEGKGDAAEVGDWLEKKNSGLRDARENYEASRDFFIDAVRSSVKKGGYDGIKGLDKYKDFRSESGKRGNAVEYFVAASAAKGKNFDIYADIDPHFFYTFEKKHKD